MIIVQFTSGLGNQMFQYAFYRFLQELYPKVEVKADVNWFHGHKEHNGYELENIFARKDNPGFHIEKASIRDILKVTGLIPTFLGGRSGPFLEKLKYYPNRILRLFSREYHKQFHIHQMDYEDNEQVYKKIQRLDLEKNWYFSGFWVEEIYYKDRIHSLRKELSFQEETMGKKNKDYMEKIKNSQSVSIHVRRGDYIGKYKGDFCLLDMDYYKKAVDYVEGKREGELTYFIFSDDKEFIEREFSWLPRKWIVTGNTGMESYRDMQLMKSCDSHILANSTFSIWGALLDGKENPLCVYPKEYMRKKDNEKKTMDGWCQIGKGEELRR